jgi:hypothetical protein
VPSPRLRGLGAGRDRRRGRRRSQSRVARHGSGRRLGGCLTQAGRSATALGPTSTSRPRSCLAVSSASRPATSSASRWSEHRPDAGGSRQGRRASASRCQSRSGAGEICWSHDEAGIRSGLLLGGCVAVGLRPLGLAVVAEYRSPRRRNSPAGGCEQPAHPAPADLMRCGSRSNPHRLDGSGAAARPRSGTYRRAVPAAGRTWGTNVGLACRCSRRRGRTGGSPRAAPTAGGCSRPEDREGSGAEPAPGMLRP